MALFKATFVSSVSLQILSQSPRLMLFVIVIVTLNMLIKLAAVIVYTPVFLVPAILTAVIGAWFGHMYVRAQMSVKRELSNAKSPVLGVLGSAMDGLGEDSSSYSRLQKVDTVRRSVHQSVPGPAALQNGASGAH